MPKSHSPGFDPSILRHRGSKGRQMKQRWITYKYSSYNQDPASDERVLWSCVRGRLGQEVRSHGGISQVRRVSAWTMIHRFIYSKIHFSSLIISVSDPDWIPDSIRSVDPDSESGSSRAKKTTKIETSKVKNFMFWSAGCYLLRAEGFCSLDVLYGGIGISKLQFLIKKYHFFQH